MTKDMAAKDAIADANAAPVTVGVVAHDGKKADLVEFVRTHRHVFRRYKIVATGTTGGLVETQTGLEVERLASGPEGGDLQIGSRIADAKLHALIFLRDPLTAHPHEPDIQALLKVCDIHGVPVATNLASAEILIHFLDENRDNFGACTLGTVMDITNTPALPTQLFSHS